MEVELLQNLIVYFELGVVDVVVASQTVSYWSPEWILGRVFSEFLAWQHLVTSYCIAFEGHAIRCYIPLRPKQTVADCWRFLFNFMICC